MRKWSNLLSFSMFLRFSASINVKFDLVSSIDSRKSMMSWKMVVPKMILEMSWTHGHMKTLTETEVIGR